MNYPTISLEAHCLHITDKTHAEAPLKDGEPDYTHMVVYKLNVEKNCAVIQVHQSK